MNKSYLFCLLLLFINININAQYIIAGQHEPGDYFVDIVPDTMIADVQNTTIDPEYPLDINGDNVIDLTLRSSNNGGLGGGASSSYILLGSESVKIATGESDTCFLVSGNINYINSLAKLFSLNDTIDQSTLWDTTLVIAYSYSVNGQYYCSGSHFSNTPTPQFIGVRIINQFDTAYGWIRISNVSSGFLLEEYAGNMTAVDIHENQQAAVNIFPNPSGKTFHFSVSSDKYTELFIYNLRGQPVYHKTFRNETVVEHLEPGMYIYELRSDQFVKNGRIIKL